MKRVHPSFVLLAAILAFTWYRHPHSKYSDYPPPLSVSNAYVVTKDNDKNNVNAVTYAESNESTFNPDEAVNAVVDSGHTLERFLRNFTEKAYPQVLSDTSNAVMRLREAIPSMGRASQEAAFAAVSQYRE